MNFPNLQEFYCYGNRLTSLPENMNFPNLQEFYCSYNQLTSLPENMNFPNLQEFYCYGNRLTSLPENMNFPNLQEFNCSYNQLTSLPENMNFPKLQAIYCNDNKLTSLPENMNFPNIQEFYCSDNQLTSLPENMNFPNLQEFNCSYNQLTSLPENMNFPNLQEFYCSYNQLTSLPENMNFPNLQEFNCSYNQLTSLPENMNFPNLQEFNCSYNQLTSLPVCIMHWRNLRIIDYSNNEIELTPQLARFISRIRTGSITKINVYGDGQNVHNTSIQCSVRDSINRLTTRLYLPKFDAEILNAMILTDEIITPSIKVQLIEYCHDNSVHSLLLLTFAEVLWYVLNTIIHDFKDSLEIQAEIKRVLNQEMQDAECKCFTGRMNRVVNCLNGFSPLVDIRISDGEQIGNVIVMLKDKALDSGGNYSVPMHKQLVKRELQERGYDSETVSKWLEYIE
jgi:Leucine-rich repeat (LRR) protein